MHEHEEFIIGLIEDEAWCWAVGRKEGGNFVDGNFNDAVDKCAELLIEEYNAMVQVDTFFSSN